MIQFFQSVMGRTFYEGTMPRIARALEAIGAEMKRANDLSQEETAPLPAVVTDGEAAEKAVQDILRRMFDAADDAEKNDMIGWARGIDDLDEDEDDATDDVRPWIMGDVMHSRPLVINYGGADPDNPDVRVVLGTNGGFLHMFGAADGIEDWAFFPKEMAPLVNTLYFNNTADPHPYGVDGSPVSYIVDNDRDGTIEVNSGDKVYLYFGLRRGGESYYALNLSSPSSPAMLWRTDNTVLTELGQSWSVPEIGKIPGHANPVVVVGAGYDTNKDAGEVGTADSVGRGIYVLDAVDGSLVWSVTPAASSATNRQATEITDSVPGSVFLFDSNADRLVDRIYFADTGGNVWRADLVGTDKTRWTVFKLASLGGDTSTSDRRFFNQIDVVRTRHESLAFDALLLGSGNRSHPLEAQVVNRFYMLRDFDTVATIHVPNDNDDNTDACATQGSNPDGLPCNEAPAAVTEANLLDVTADDLQNGDADQQTAALSALASPTTKGWYLTLEGSGEKSLARSVTLSGNVFFTTYEPADSADASQCTVAAGTGYLYAVELNTGRAVYDWSSLNGAVLAKVDRRKKITDTVPDHVVAHFGESEIRLVGVGAGDGKGSQETGLQLQTQGTYWYQGE